MRAQSVVRVDLASIPLIRSDPSIKISHAEKAANQGGLVMVAGSQLN